MIQLKGGRQVEVLGEPKEMSTRQRRRRQARSRGHKAMPKFQNKTHYLIGVKAAGNAKDKIIGCYIANPVEIQSNNKKKNKMKNCKQIKKEKRN